MNLKIGGSNVGKIMYNGQEFGGATKLEPGTIFYLGIHAEDDIKNLHLPSTTKNWSNINGINVSIYTAMKNYLDFSDDFDIVGDDFKNLDTEKQYITKHGKITVSRSIVDGEYRLNVQTIKSNRHLYVVKAI